MPAQGNYFLPADQEEFDRLESVHQMTTAVLGDLFWGPVDKKLIPRPSGRRRCVLDVGTGTGSWVREMAEKYEKADFIGIDIVPIPPPASTIAEMGVGSLLRTTYEEPADGGYSMYSGGRFAMSSENLAAMLLGTPIPTPVGLPATPGPYDYGTPAYGASGYGTPGYGTPAQTPYSNYGTPRQTEVHFVERDNVRFEIQDISEGLEFPDGVFDIIHCRYVLTLGVPDYKTAIRELVRVLRPGGLLLMAESSVPFCLSDGSDPALGTATRELIEIVRASIKEAGLDPELRLKLSSELINNPKIEKIETREFALPLGDWPTDVSLHTVGRNGLENLAVGLRSLTPLLRQVGYDDAMISMLASRLHDEWDVNEIGSIEYQSILSVIEHRTACETRDRVLALSSAEPLVSRSTMPLVRIEVCDFKSYRGHQLIGPFKNFTSVIGPNGAGKSNLMDAISFVLGVKSAQLRSSQLKDLVYRGRRLERTGEDGQEAGSDDEGEDEGEGTAKKAWVMAVYQDAEGKEYQFQRTVSTSGSSEYKLNGKVVTYQAYNSTLEQHNILVKAKNFLVFQGDVEAVASQSSKELSRLIDQISGSLELAPAYEKAKAAQDRATENAANNFTKRRGIAGEIKQFKEQKGEVERYEALIQEREEAVVHRLLWQLFHLGKDIESNAQTIRTKSKELKGLKKQQAADDAKVNSAREDQAKARADALKVEKALKKMEKALDAKASPFLMSHIVRKTDKARSIGETVQRDAQKKEADLERMKKELADVQQTFQRAQEAHRRALEQGSALSEESLAEYHRLKAQAAREAVEERQKRETLIRENKVLARNLASQNSKLEQLTTQRDKLKSDVTSVGEKRTEVDDKVKNLQSELKNAKHELEKAQSDRIRITQLETEINEKLHDVHTKLMQAGVDQQESAKDARLKETLEKLQRVFPGVRGRVIDLCKPSQRKYETAVITVLGRNIDAIVVDHEKTAIDCIEYMRQQRVGQATFIPLESIQTKPVNDKYRSFARGARLAIDVIQYEPVVERAMFHACGNALVCDTMEVARYVCYEKGQEVKAVTLDGTVIHKTGLITGGRGHGTTRKWEEKEIQALNKQKDSLHAQLRELGQSKPRGKVDEGLAAEINRIESQLQLAKDDQSALKSRLTGLKDELKHVESELRKLNPEVEQVRPITFEVEMALTVPQATVAHNSANEQIEELSDAINQAEDEVFAAFCQEVGVSNIREYEEQQLKAQTEELETKMRFESQIARLSHQIAFEEDQLKSINARLQTLEQTVANETASLEKLTSDKDRLAEQIDELQQELDEHREEATRLNELLAEATKVLDGHKRTAMQSAKEVDKSLKEIAACNDSIEKAAAERLTIYRRCILEEINLPLESGSLKSIPLEPGQPTDGMDLDDEDETQRAREVQDYGIEVDFDGLTDDERANGSAEIGAELDAEITRLAGEIERMAPNMKAMERLDDVEAKLAETEKEAEKARKESKQARDEFNEIKKRRCDLFNKAYNHIAERIDQVYKDLTKGKAAPMGGVAYLSLEDSEEPYNSGIKYHAMPPMKRFRDMEQLSGGEKTVAALALLFAIHSFQPSPFFVLDEVDAALDNTNVAKVANYIRQHSSEAFQFIVISLKGSLYEKGNSLVGIYRDQDVNSSRTLTLDLTQYTD
ncbi:Structural maintenance of chromosomes protein [Rhizoctonia solani]|uniref:Structural maintenance of chromosomes protein n=1 Tax=Rhizoctonia solani TaxID=456999 RepID=A0A8H7HB64_9AGAM|nr:Structural maintenance of chromosomes protein [Rhizoctonia solani]